jgi:nitronate monooxygenase
MATLSTRLTQALKLRHPVVSAPMAFAGGGALAAAVSHAGGLGLIGGGYGDPTWLEEQFAAAAGQRVGVGFITWSLHKSPSLLTDVLRHRPTAVMLSFGDPRPFVDEIRSAGALVICQCQNMSHVMDAVEVEAAVVVAQGAEAGGHGALRGTLTFVPEVADYLAKHAPGTLLLAAGGIADGRGLAAALVLGGGRCTRWYPALGVERGTGTPKTSRGHSRNRRRRHHSHNCAGHRTPNSVATRLYGASPTQRVHQSMAWARGRT